jgi:hypothetical protein
MKCEIVDEKGGTLGAVANALRKCIKEGASKQIGEGTICQFQFGWIIAPCDGPSQVIPSPTFKLQITKLDVSYMEGKIKYTITGNAIEKVYDTSKEETTKGEDSKPANLEQAIESLCAQDPACRVRYCELTSDGKLKDVKFEWARVKDPPEASWQSDNMNRMSTIVKWLSPFRVKDGKCDKGIVLYFNPKEPNELIILKNPMAGPGEARECIGGADLSNEMGPLGTFIVNGGKCSTVIEFTPEINIIAATATLAAGGGTSGPNKSSSQLAEDKRCENQKSQGKEAGTQLQATITQQAFDSYGTKSANDEALRSEIAHHEASLVTSINHPGVTARLKILGNPTARFCNIGAARNLSIVVINPFHIRNMGQCGDWLAYPGCNDLFTNKLYMCRSINHAITPGSYTTEIEAYLVSPSIQISSFDPLGGQGGGGPVLKNNCQ